MSWPDNIPSDLRREIDNLLSMRNVTAAEFWSLFRNWNIKHGIQRPESLPAVKHSDDILYKI